jgi:hypothetical protein
MEPGWNLEKNCIRTMEQAERLNGCNIGIAHLWSGTCALDADDYAKASDWLAARGIYWMRSWQQRMPSRSAVVERTAASCYSAPPTA